MIRASPVQECWAGVLTAVVFYAEYISFGAALGSTISGRSGAAMGALMVLGAVLLASLVAAFLPRPLLAGPRGASVAVLITGMKLSSTQIAAVEYRSQAAIIGLFVVLFTAALVQLMGLLRPVQSWIESSSVALRKGFMFATGVGIIVSVGGSQFKTCLLLDTSTTALVVIFSVAIAIAWNSLCKAHRYRGTVLSHLAPLAIPLSVAVATTFYYWFISPLASNGYCGTLGSSGMRFSLFADLTITGQNFGTVASLIPVWTWPILIAIGGLLGCVMLLESLTTLRDSKDASPRPCWSVHLRGSALANAVAAVLGFSCSSLSTSRSNALIEAHARTRWAAVTHGVAVLTIAVFFSTWIAALPQLAVGVALMIVAVQMIDDEMRRDVWAAGFQLGARRQALNTSWLFLGMVVASAIAGIGLIQLGWGFGGGPLLALLAGALALHWRAVARRRHSQ